MKSLNKNKLLDFDRNPFDFVIRQAHDFTQGDRNINPIVVRAQRSRIHTIVKFCKKFNLTFLIIFFITNLFIANDCAGIVSNHINEFNKPRTFAHATIHFLSEVVHDALELNLNLFSLNSVKIITAFTPLYLTTRMFDESVQKNFHNRLHHMNINQLPTTCHHIAKYGVGIPMVLLSSLAVFAQDIDLRMTARIFAIGLPFVHSGKDVLKGLRSDNCLRPWHEDFDHHRRSSGGFPSGHMANISFAATLFGMRFGWQWALPLGAFASFVFVDFLNCNRHYLSQLVAGVGLGVMFAVAANKLIEKKLSKNYHFCCNIDQQGLQCGVSYKF